MEVSSMPRLLHSMGEAKYSNQKGGYLDSRARLEALEKRKICCPCQDFKHDLLVA